MDNLTKKLIMHSLNWGLILGCILIFMSLLTYIFGINPAGYGYIIINLLLTIGVTMGIMAWTSISFRDKFLEKRITFLRCITAGLIVGICATILVSIYTFLFNYFFDPDYMVQVMEQTKEATYERLENANLSDEEIEGYMSGFKETPTAVNQLVATLISMGIMTIVFALLSTLFVRKKEKVKETNIY